MLRKKACMYQTAFIICWIPSELCVLMCVYACLVCVCVGGGHASVEGTFWVKFTGVEGIFWRAFSG